MSISKRKLGANRENAQKSTGPTSQERKQIASSNRVQHGLCGRFRVLDCENQDDYNRLLERFLEAEQTRRPRRRARVRAVKQAPPMLSKHDRRRGELGLVLPSNPEPGRLKKSIYVRTVSKSVLAAANAWDPITTRSRCRVPVLVKAKGFPSGG